MRKLTFLALSLTFAMMISSCGGDKKTNEEQGDSTVVEQTKSEHYIGIEKGSMKYEMETMGIITKMDYTWADYGKKINTTMTMEMMGEKVKSYTISNVDSGYVYTWTENDKNGLKVKFDESTQVNYDNLSADEQKKLNMKEIGSDKVLGRNCKIFSQTKDGVTTKVWVWNNLPLKTEATSMGIKTEMIVTELNENIDVDPKLFEVPTDINFKEETAESLQKQQ